jgi:hypothetical protein
MTVAIRNAEMIDNLSSELQRRYEPNFSIAMGLATWMSLPFLRGLWTFNARTSAGIVADMSGNGKTLSPGIAGPTYARFSLKEYALFASASSQYLLRADEADLDITGNLTMLGWFYFTTVPASAMNCMGKYTGGGNQSYLLYKLASNALSFLVSTDGAANVVVNSVGTVSASAWYFLAGRFTASSELKVWLDNVTATNLVGVPASIFNSAADFIIGRHSATAYLNGRCGMAALCAGALTDIQVMNAYEQSRALFGK